MVDRGACALATRVRVEQSPPTAWFLSRVRFGAYVDELATGAESGVGGAAERICPHRAARSDRRTCLAPFRSSLRSDLLSHRGRLLCRCSWRQLAAVCRYCVPVIAPFPTRQDATATYRVSRITVTLIWPGYCKVSWICSAMSRPSSTQPLSSISLGCTSTRSSRPACRA